MNDDDIDDIETKISLEWGDFFVYLDNVWQAVVYWHIGMLIYPQKAGDKTMHPIHIGCNWNIHVAAKYVVNENILCNLSVIIISSSVVKGKCLR